MKILQTQVLRGPNYWSNYRKKLIWIKLDLEGYEELPTNLIPGFTNRLMEKLPSLHSHYCSPGYEGGLLERMQEGTWLGHVIEHVALEMQSLAGMDCGFGRTHGTGTYGIYDVIFSYQLENAGLYAANAAVEFVRAIAEQQEYDLLNDLRILEDIFIHEGLGPSTQALVTEAEKRKIPYKRYLDTSLILLGHGRQQKKLWASTTSKTSAIGMDIACDKELTKQILDANFIPTPKGIAISYAEDLPAAIERLGYPLAIKPVDANHGKGVSLNINTFDKALFGFELAKSYSNHIIVERFITGADYRFLVINYKVVAVAKRTPAAIVGDGISTIEDLIKIANEDPNRGVGHEKTLTTIKVDESTLAILQHHQLNLKSILPQQKILYLKETANLSSGGTASDVTDLVHPYNIFLAERAARIMELDVCGLDIISNDISIPLTSNNGAVIEINAGPGLRMHLSPTEGKPRNVAEPLLKMLFPTTASATIPIVAVTGTNGKTTVVRLISHLARFCGFHHTGSTTTEGIYINNHLIHSGDCSGPNSAEMVLQSPEVDFAVLECARGGILRSGLGFDECDISIITNITEDHLGLNGIKTLEDLADVKAVVAKSTKKSGCAILNADNQLTYEIHQNLDCQIALFSKFQSPRIRKHCAGGGLAAYIDVEYLILQHGKDRHQVIKLSELPISFNGTATCMIMNTLPAILAAYQSNFSIEKIREGLACFYPTPENLPGRMNLFKLKDCDIMIDYAHNPGAYLELKNYLQSISSSSKIGIIGAAGDRRDEDIEHLGFLAGPLFDEIIIRHDKDGRGRTDDNISFLIRSGIKRSGSSAQVREVSDELEAIQQVIANSKQHPFVFCAVEDVFTVTSLLSDKAKEKLPVNEVYHDAQS